MAETLRIATVTGIDLDLPIAGPGGRSYAFVIDWHIRLLVALAWFLLASLVLTGGLEILDSEDAAFTLYIFGAVIPPFAIYFLYHPVLELAMGGRTPGKRIAGIRIVTVTGEIPGAGAILIRNVLRLIDSLPGVYAIGLAATMLTEQSVRIGDMAAGTLLIYDEDKTDGFAAPNSAAVSGVGLQNVELVGELLERWPDLSPAARVDLGRRLLERIGAYMPEGEDEIREALEGALH
jgi:uncharacterized RDD family membrane protein YckC